MSKKKNYTVPADYMEKRYKKKSEKRDNRISRTLIRIVKNISVVLVLQILLIVVVSSSYVNPDSLDAENLNTAAINVDEVIEQDIFIPSKYASGTRYLLRSGEEVYQFSISLIDKDIPRGNISKNIMDEGEFTIVYGEKSSLFRGKYNYVYEMSSESATYYTVADSLRRLKDNNLLLLISGLILESIFVGVVGAYLFVYIRSAEFVMFKRDIKKR